MDFRIVTAALCVVIAASPAAAKPARGRRPSVPTPAAPTQVAPPAPAAVGAATSTGTLMTPKEVVMRPMTPVEAEANAIWSTRAGLNIAALQCQFSPYLATVRNYNDFLRQHAEELDRARATMIAHFKRYDGAQAQNSFDRYTTQTYNSYSTLDAQISFCDAAGLAGQQSLTIRKGSFGREAARLRAAMRAALVPVDPLSLIQPVPLAPADLPPL
ncbi:MAG: hypothetical protein JO290_04985 [Sphingomonadaceae bacterium]|nr:hypothetical protein [Sphingomonadaceae bacterium]